MIDISEKLSNARPVVKVNDKLIFTVNDEKNNVLKMQYILKNDGEDDDIKKLNAALTLLIGKENTQKLDCLSFGDYVKVATAVIAAALGMEEEPFRKGI